MTRTSFATLFFAITIAVASFSGCSRVQQQLRTGDEPPIRVRGGTMHLDLLAEGDTDFEKDNASDKKKWHIKGSPNRDRNKFLVVIVSASANCNGKVASANKVDIVYSDGQNVEFKSNSQNTKITAQKDLEYQGAKWLKYEVDGGFISAVKVDNQNLCTFGAKDGTLQIFLLD
jgi:hypothetical protein